MIMIFFRYFFLLIVFSLILSCSKNNIIPKVEDGIFKKSKDTNSIGITIFPGDTLLTLSKKYKVSIKELIKYNNLEPPFVLKPGKRLMIPKPLYYKVKKNDTFFKIAKCHDLKIQDLKDRNKKIEDKKIQIGNILKLPYYAKKNKCLKSKIKNNRKDMNKLNTRSLFAFPTEGKIIATFGKKESGRRNDGINIKAAEGNPVRAALSGKIIYRGNELPAWGNLILIKHKGGWTTAYAHLKKYLVKQGDLVKTGDVIGLVGRSGSVNNSQLHFQIRKKSKPVNPITYLKKFN